MARVISAASADSRVTSSSRSGYFRARIVVRCAAAASVPTPWSKQNRRRREPLRVVGPVAQH